ncbi:(+)-neomenthol dehydrogenase-like [Andrographis paniculata]|uniref:(+)-neomenthol dehydrogenase-like n=1 Tax=Andrographis paniculata TaxID=175694 RepID=UPI0021E8D920|nr:(+)-neomenthol dehydrogenase-like [Andrographis paniculata]
MVGAIHKYAVVTGANKGIGFEICKQLATQGNITVVLAARDHNRGLEAVEKLKELGHGGGQVIFQQLDVTDSVSVAAFAEFIKSKFGKLDILVNNAGVSGANVDGEAMRAAASMAEDPSKVNWSEIIVETYETAEAAFQINYYGAKRTTEALLPLLKLSQSPRIVNMASVMAMLQNVSHEWAKGVLSNVENLTEEKLDEVANQYLKDVKDGVAKEKGWPASSGSYVISKAVLTAYTRLVAKRHPSCKINAVCPGFTKTDMNHHSGFLTVEQGAESPVRLALLGDDGPSGLFFNRKQVSQF